MLHRAHAPVLNRPIVDKALKRVIFHGSRVKSTIGKWTNTSFLYYSTDITLSYTLAVSCGDIISIAQWRLDNVMLLQNNGIINSSDITVLNVKWAYSVLFGCAIVPKVASFISGWKGSYRFSILTIERSIFECQIVREKKTNLYAISQFRLQE